MFLVAYYVLAVLSFLLMKKPLEIRVKRDTPAAEPTTNENADPFYPLVP